MTSSDPRKRTAQRIAIDYPVEILKQPTTKKTVKGKPHRRPKTAA